MSIQWNCADGTPCRAQAEGGTVPRVCKCVELTPREHNYCSDCGGAIVIYDVAPRASEVKEQCEHEWVSADHPPQVVGCAICRKCHTIASAQDVGLQPAPAAAPERRRTEYTPGGHPVSVVDGTAAAPTDDAALIALPGERDADRD